MGPRTYCIECGAKATIQKTNRITNKYADIYYNCTDPDCACVFVEHKTFGHIVRPSAKKSSQLISGLIENLNPDKLQELKQQLSIL